MYFIHAPPVFSILGTDITIVVEKDALLSPQFQPAATCANETASFELRGKLASVKTLAVWLTQMRQDSTPAAEFERQPDVHIGPVSSPRPFRVSICAARTLNPTGQSRVTLSLR